MAEADWYEPRSRFWHSAQLVKGRVVVRGGCIPGIDDKKGRREMLKNIEVFEIKTRKWFSRKTKGDRHPGLSSVACASYGKYLYAYGGLDGAVLNGVLSELNLETLVWTQLSPKTSAGPMRKDASGIVHFGDGMLAVVCGYAYPNKPKLPNGGSSDLDSTFILRSGSPNYAGGGWTNEMHLFDIGSSKLKLLFIGVFNLVGLVLRPHLNILGENGSRDPPHVAEECNLHTCYFCDIHTRTSQVL